MGTGFHDHICVCDAGNMVEWCLPHDINLDGVEFKSMASGSHRITSDFMCVFHSAATVQVNSAAVRLFISASPSFTDISVKAATSGWPVSPTCPWSLSWKEARG